MHTYIATELTFEQLERAVGRVKSCLTPKVLRKIELLVEIIDSAAGELDGQSVICAGTADCVRNYLLDLKAALESGHFQERLIEKLEDLRGQRNLDPGHPRLHLECEELYNKLEFLGGLSMEVMPPLILLREPVPTLNVLYISTIEGYIWYKLDQKMRLSQTPVPAAYRTPAPQPSSAYPYAATINHIPPNFLPHITSPPDAPASDDEEDGPMSAANKMRRGLPVAGGRLQFPAGFLGPALDTSPAPVPVLQPDITKVGALGKMRPCPQLDLGKPANRVKKRQYDEQAAGKISEMLNTTENWDVKASSMLRYLRRTQDLSKLEFRAVCITDFLRNNDIAIAAVLQGIARINKLKFASIVNDPSTMLKVLSSLAPMVDIGKLSFEGVAVYVNADVIPHLARATDLCLTQCTLSFVGNNALLNIISTTKRIRRLKLKKCRLSDREVDLMKGVLAMNRSIEVLDLSFNEISVRGLRVLASVCQVNRTLTKINLRGNLLSYRDVGIDIHAMMAKRGVPIEIVANTA